MLRQPTDKKLLLHVLQSATGVIFVISGLLKANDPVGFSYKLQEYMAHAGLNSLHSLALPSAVLICAAEMLTGSFLLLGIYKKLTVRALLAAILFFTLLTFISAAFKIVTSCGCFGDAIPLTPWQSFTKDVLLLVAIVYIFINRENLYTFTRFNNRGKITAIILSFCSLALPVCAAWFGPAVDFLPYYRGVNIPAQMQIPAGQQGDVYGIVYTLKNGKGETKKMGDKEYLASGIWKNADWEIIGEPEKQLLKKGYHPPIADLHIVDESGSDYTSELLENPFYNIVVVAYDLNSANKAALSRINGIAAQATQKHRTRCILLTASAPATAKAILKQAGLIFEPFYADDVPLKQMVRSNPGVLLLKDGTIVNKWQYSTLPAYKELEDNYLAKP